MFQVIFRLCGGVDRLGMRGKWRLGGDCIVAGGLAGSSPKERALARRGVEINVEFIERRMFHDAVAVEELDERAPRP